ncbi:MAG: tetratricopeptide repeat protein [Bacteroidia bacterium]|nr:tetratricopeptide repeat protein [Bacteroidia bacterium]
MRDFLKYSLFLLIIPGCFLLPLADCRAQSNFKADSLRVLLKNAKEDTGKINNLNYLGWELKKNNIDTAILLSQQAVDLAQKLCANPQASQPQIIKSAKTGLANALGNLGVYCRNKGDYEPALAYFFRALKIDEELKYKRGIAARFGNIGLVYYDKGEYPKALDYYFKAMKMGEEMGDKNRVSIQLGNIGIVYHDQGDLKKALEYYFKALRLGEELGNKKGVALRLGNIGLVYENMGDNEKALSYYLKAFSMFEEQGDKNGMGIWLGNIGNIYKELHDDAKAMDYYLRALKLREELGSKSLIATCLGNIGALHTLNKNYKEGFNSFQRAIALSYEIGSLNSLKTHYKLISTLYEQSTIPLPDTIGGKMLNMEQMRLRALYYYRKHVAIGDTLFSEENEKQLVRKEMNYEFEKKEAAAKAEQLKNEEIAKAESKKQKIIIISVVSCLLLVVAFAGFIFRALKITRRQKNIIESQKDLVDEKQKEILDSIYYARRIQRTLITSEKYIVRNLRKLNSGKKN